MTMTRINATDRDNVTRALTEIIREADILRQYLNDEPPEANLEPGMTPWNSLSIIAGNTANVNSILWGVDDGPLS